MEVDGSEMSIRLHDGMHLVARDAGSRVQRDEQGGHREAASRVADGGREAGRARVSGRKWSDGARRLAELARVSTQDGLPNGGHPGHRAGMNEDEKLKTWLERKKAGKARAEIPFPEFPKDAALSVKSIAYLHVYCRKSPEEIRSRFPRVLTLGDVHAALAHYYRNRQAFDEEIARERQFNTPKGLGDVTLSLPKVEGP